MRIKILAEQVKSALFAQSGLKVGLPRCGPFEDGGLTVGHKVAVHGEVVAVEVGADVDARFVGACGQRQVQCGRDGSSKDGEVHEDVSVLVL